MRLLVAAVVVTSASACTRPDAEFAISRDVLPDVLADVYVAEARAMAVDSNLVDARVAALHRHGFDTVAFNETMLALAEDPEEAKRVYQAVLDSVIFAQRDIRAKVLADSIYFPELGAGRSTR